MIIKKHVAEKDRALEEANSALDEIRLQFEPSVRIKADKETQTDVCKEVCFHFIIKFIDEKPIERGNMTQDDISTYITTDTLASDV